MKLVTRHPSLVTTLCIVHSAFCIAFATLAAGAANVAIVRDGAPVAKVYIAADDPAPAEWVATNAPTGNALWYEPRDKALRRYFAGALFDLADVIRRSSGASLETVAVTSPDEIKGPAIVAGSLAAMCGVRPSATNLLGETFVLRTEGDRLYLAGDGILGQTFAIYAFLNEMGVAWLMPDALGEVIPERKTWEIAIDREEAPSFPVRNPWINAYICKATPRETAEWFKWQVRNREQTRPAVTDIYMQEATIESHGFRGKAWDWWFEKHPECASLQIAPDGKRKYARYQLNMTAPATEDLFALQVAKIYEKRGWAKDERHVIYVGPSDGGGYDMSDASAGVIAGRRDPVSGDWDQTDVVFGFFGRLLGKLTNDYPNIVLRTLIYNTYEDFPTREPPPASMLYTYADINQSRYHGACDAGVSPSRAYYRHVIEKWGKSGVFLTFYHYDFNLAETVLPYTRLRIIGEDMPWEHRNGCKGFQDEYWVGYSYAAPHDWLQARMGWNVALDWKEETKRFCRLAYGDGAETMLRYWMTLVEKQRTQNGEAGSFHSHGRVWSEDEAKALLALCEKAEAEAKTPAEKGRVRVAAYASRQLVHFTAFTAAYSRYDFAAARDAADAMFAEYSASQKGEYPLAACRWSPEFMRWLRDFAKAALKYSEPSTNGAWRIVAKVPDRLKVQMNPQFNGELLNLQSPLLDDAQFPEVPTWSSTPSATGLVTLRAGELWYRFHFKTPKTDLADGEGFGLFLGGFDHVATVYVNGAKVGTATGFAKSAVFDLTGRLAPAGGENLAAICITRRQNAEAMTGGILYPCFLFAGPRVPPSAGADDNFKIILPGMGR
jgi:hypothetical protein